MQIIDDITAQADHIVTNYIGDTLRAKIIELAQNWYMHGNADCFMRMKNKTADPVDNTQVK